MKRSILLLLVFAGAALVWSQAPASSTKLQTAPGQSHAATGSNGLTPRGPETVAQQDPKRVVATIGGNPITAEQALHLLKELPGNPTASGDLEKLLEQVYVIDRFSGEAVKTNLDNQSPWKEDIEFARKRILAQAYVDRDNQIGQAAQQFYNAHPDQFEEVRLSGILISFAPPGTPSTTGKSVRTEEEARAKADNLEKKLQSGTDFATLARTDSDNPQTASRGGDFGSLNLNAPGLPASVKTAVSTLQPGQISQPVPVRGGFYIFKVASRSKVPFEQVRSQIIASQIYDQYKLAVQDPAFFNATQTPSLANPSGNASRTNPAAPLSPGTPAKPSPSHH